MPAANTAQATPPSVARPGHPLAARLKPVILGSLVNSSFKYPKQ